MTEDWISSPHLYWAFYGLFAVLGAAVGSFCNVVIYRLPIMLKIGRYADGVLLAKLQADHGQFNLSFPASGCPSCGAKIKPWHNVPVLGWLALGGKCASCQSPISMRYIVVELTITLAWVALVHAHGLSLATVWVLLVGTTTYCIAAIYADQTALAKPLLYWWLAFFAGLVFTSLPGF